MAVKNVASNIQGSASNDQGALSGAPSTSHSTQQIRPRYALVANKIDQEHMRVIKSERHHKFAQVTRNQNYLQSVRGYPSTPFGFDFSLKSVHNSTFIYRRMAF